jgi:sulfonate transport system substrate-binding protein
VTRNLSWGRTVRNVLSALACASLSCIVLAQTAPIAFKIGAAGATDHAPAFVGVERGIFAKHGLDVKIVMYESGVDMLNGLLNNAQDVNIMGSTPFLAGTSRGQPLVLIGHLHGDALSTGYSSNLSIVSTPASGAKVGDFKALKGKKIGLTRGTGAETYVLDMLQRNGMKQADVTLINLSPANLVTALRQGDVDAVSSYEPWASLSAMRVPNAFRIVSGDCDTCYDPGTILTTRDVIAARADALKRFMVAFAEAEQVVRQNLDAAAEVDMRWIKGVDMDIMKSAIRRSNFDLRLSRNTLDGYSKNAIPGLVADKRMAKSLDPTTIIDAQFYKYAETTAPQFFSDLKPIPADRRYP